MQELLTLLNEQKYQEALAGFQKMYEMTNNPIALYYITFIKYYYLQETNLEELYNNFKILFDYSKDIRLHIYDFYLSFLMDNKDYELGLDIASKAIKETNHNFINCFAYSKCLAKQNKSLNTALEYAKKSIEIEDLTELQKVIAYSNLIEIYSMRKEFDLAKENINKLYLMSSNVPYITLLELQLAMDMEDENEIERLAKESLQYEQNEFETLRLLCIYYYEHDNYDLAIKYHKQIKPLMESQSFINEKLALCYLFADKYDEGINLLNEEPLDDLGHNYYLLGEFYYYKGGKRNYKKAVENYNKSLDLAQNKVKVLNALGNVYFELVDTENLMKIVEELHKHSKHGYVDFLEASYYRLVQKFDEAEKLLKHMKSPEVPNFRINNIIETCSSKPEVLTNYHNRAFNEMDKYALRNRVKFLMFGEHGNKIDMEEAKKHVEMLEKMDNLSTCAYSVISNYYLFNNEDEKAYKTAYEGYEKYLKDEEPCQCCASFVAYCKLKGRGTEKDIEGAYKICKDIEERELGDINENAGHVYAECAILLGKDLNYIYNLLEKTLFRRYSTSRYFMLVKIGKLLNKDVSKRQKLLQESLKHCSQREKEYYSTEQTEFLLNNY